MEKWVCETIFMPYPKPPKHNKNHVQTFEFGSFTAFTPTHSRASDIAIRKKFRECRIGGRCGGGRCVSLGARIIAGDGDRERLSASPYNSAWRSWNSTSATPISPEFLAVEATHLAGSDCAPSPSAILRQT